MARAYTPNAGDIVWLEFDPQAGHEQAGRRPAVVLTPEAYNKKTNLMVDHIKLEQSTFNLYLFKHGYQGWEDKSNSFQFACDEKTKFLPNKNFHFNKYQLKMNLKFKMMESFLQINSLYSKLDYRQ